MVNQDFPQSAETNRSCIGQNRRDEEDCRQNILPAEEKMQLIRGSKGGTLLGDGLRLAAPRLSLIVNNSFLDDLHNQKSLKGVVGTETTRLPPPASLPVVKSSGRSSRFRRV